MTADEALELSIKHWDELSRKRSPSNVQIGAEFCALCKEFQERTDAGGRSCGGCPVRAATGMVLCNGTPFHKAYWSLSEARNAVRTGLPVGDAMARFRADAREELAFLKSLRKPPQ